MPAYFIRVRKTEEFVTARVPPLEEARAWEEDRKDDICYGDFGGETEGERVVVTDVFEVERVSSLP